MSASIRREGTRVWLEGVKGWSFREKQSSVHAAQEAAMRAVGEDVTYDYLLGVSGLAFRMQVSRGSFCPSSPHSFCGYRCVARSREALPWEVQVFETKPDKTEGLSAARQAVVHSIERGVPVQYGNEEDGIIIGYQRMGEEWICLHPLRDRGQKPFVTGERAWGVAVFTHRKPEMPPRRDLALGALQQAVRMARADDADNYYVGFRAWDDYIRRLKAMETADDGTKNEALLGNAWIYECLASYRASASKYLREIAEDFEAPVAERLVRAADLYERLSNGVLREGSPDATSITPYPRGPDQGKPWTTEIRQEQVRRLEAALLLERPAIAEIEAAICQVAEGS